DGRALLSDGAVAPARGDVDASATGGRLSVHAYLAPERWGDAPRPTAAGDVYAFAALLHEIATGAPPVTRALAAIAGHERRPLPPLGLTAPHLPGEAGTVPARGLAAAPE